MQAWWKRSAEPVPARPTKMGLYCKSRGVLEDYKATRGAVRFRLVGTQAGNSHSQDIHPAGFISSLNACTSLMA